MWLDRLSVDSFRLHKDLCVTGPATNPYESPRSFNGELNPTVWSAIARGIVRLLVLGMVGYASFTAFGLLYWAMSDPNVGQASIPWALSIGLLGGIAFPCSEVFNSGLGAASGVVRRVLVAIGVLLLSLIVAALVAQALGWNQRTYDSDPWAVPRDALAVIVFLSGLVAARIAWIKE